MKAEQRICIAIKHLYYRVIHKIQLYKDNRNMYICKRSVCVPWIEGRDISAISECKLFLTRKFSNGNSLVYLHRAALWNVTANIWQRSIYPVMNRTKTGGRGEWQQREREEPEAGEEKKSRRRAAGHEETEKRNFCAREELEEARE